MTPGPEDLRLASILPEEDADEAFCERHEAWMKSITPLIKWDDALYSTTPDFTLYTCPQCVHEHRSNSIDSFKLMLLRLFNRWDQGDAPGDWFRYLREYDPDSDDPTVEVSR